MGIYFTDSFSNRIRALHPHYYDPNRIPRLGELTPEYNCTTVAGSVPGYQDGYGNMSEVWVPAGIALSNGGILYIADSSNNVIRKIQRGSPGPWGELGMTKPMCKHQS